MYYGVEMGLLGKTFGWTAFILLILFLIGLFIIGPYLLAVGVIILVIWAISKAVTHSKREKERVVETELNRQEKELKIKILKKDLTAKDKEVSEAKVKFCSECGKKVKKSAKFCEFCGEKQ